MRQTPVSVVIPTYNRGDMIRDAIDSLLAQTVAPAQIIVVDDGSQDDTTERLRDYGGRVSYHCQANAGPSAARNHGVRLAGEPFVAFLDADDVWHPHKLALQMREMERDAALGMLATDEFAWPAAEFPGLPADEVRVRLITWDHLVVRTMILTSSIVIRRAVLDRVGEFDTSLCGPEDRDLFLRVAEVTKVAMLMAPLVGYRDSPGSLTKQAAMCERGMRAILERLDDADAWDGRWLLRRKSYSYMHNRCSAAQARAGNHVGAVARALKALMCYPLPYRRCEVGRSFERPKRLAVNLLRMLNLKSPDPGPGAMPLASSDALQSLRRNTADSKGSLQYRM